MKSNIVRYMNIIRKACFELGIKSPIVIYIDKNTTDLTNIPKSRFTCEYADFKLSHDPNSNDYDFDDIYFSIDNLNYQDVKNCIEDFYTETYELSIRDYPFYSREYLEDLEWELDEKGNIINWID